MVLKDFIFGTQYYRAPTPLREEWYEDIPKFGGLGFNAFQIRAQWRWNEPTEGSYVYDEIDELFELAMKTNPRIITVETDEDGNLDIDRELYPDVYDWVENG